MVYVKATLQEPKRAILVPQAEQKEEVLRTQRDSHISGAAEERTWSRKRFRYGCTPLRDHNSRMWRYILYCS